MPNSDKEKLRKEYEKNMKKVENLSNKFILIQSYTGFGNKVFDCIIGMYLKINFGYTIYYVNTTSIHTKLNDPDIQEIFLKLNNQFIFIENNEGDYLKYYLKYRNEFPKIYKLHELNNYFTTKLNKDFINQIQLLTPGLYNLVYKIYDTFDNKTKKIFEINTNLINPNIKSYSGTKYATIHIRYGDKLNLAIKKKEYDNEFYKFPIYTPEYYYDQIKIIKKLGLPIVILTDSYSVVKHFILEKYNLNSDPDIFMPDVPFIDSFYLLEYSSYIVMSHSTFSYAAYLLSKDYWKNKPRVYTFCMIDEFFTIQKPHDLFIGKEWTIYNDKKYILNFNQELVKNMNKFYNK
jgi:hypothetical protein